MKSKVKKELVNCQFLKRGKYEKIYQKSVVVFLMSLSYREIVNSL